jgi:hypothetical protein
VPGLPGVESATGDADACHGADLVLSLTTAGQADSALRHALPGLSATAVYRTPTPRRRAPSSDWPAAPMRPGCVIRGRGHHGPGARTGAAHADGRVRARSGGGQQHAQRMWCEVEVLPGPRGAAATRKLLRSVFYKGLAAAAVEALLARPVR